MKTETLSSISARTGWSITTISRVLNGKGDKYRIPKSTQEAVMHEVRRCGYVPAGTAQNLRNGKTGLIGLLLPSVANPFFADMASVIISEMYKESYTTIVVDTMEDESYLLESMKTLLSRQVEGIIAAPSGEEGLMAEKINNSLPVVLVDRYYEGTTLSYVTANNYQGSFDATEYLIEMGHRRIACLQGATSSMPNKERVRGYVEAMKGEGLSDYILLSGNEFSIRNGYLETKLLLGRREIPTAIFTLSNTILLGAIKAIREAGLRIPEDISLLTFDDNLYMDYMTPVITRVSQPVDDMARLASKLLLDSLSSADRVASQLRLAPALILGESVRRIR